MKKIITFINRIGEILAILRALKYLLEKRPASTTSDDNDYPESTPV